MDDQSDDEGLDLSPLHAAVLSSDAKLVAELLDAGHEVDQRDEGERTPLHLAAQKGEEAIVRLLLRRGADCKAINEIGSTPLHSACEQDHHGVVKILLDHKADINARDRSWGATPLIVASFWTNPETVRVLLEHNADASISAYFDYSPLGCAAVKGSAEIVELLLKYKKGINMEAKSNGGLTPLLHAVANSYNKIAEMLLEHGADVNATGTSGASILHILAQKESISIPMMKLLLQHGADPKLIDDAGNTALHTAASNNQVAVTKLLVQSGVSVNEQNNRGNTALHIASEKGSADIARYLQQVGGDAKIRNSEGDLPIDLAFCADHHYIVEVLKLVSQLSDGIDKRKQSYKRDDGQVGEPHRTGSGPIAAPRKRSNSSSQRSLSPPSRTNSQGSRSNTGTYAEVTEEEIGSTSTEIKKRSSYRDTYIQPSPLGNPEVNVPDYLDIIERDIEKISVRDLPDITQGHSTLPTRMQPSLEQLQATALPSRFYLMNSQQSVGMPPFQPPLSGGSATEKKKRSKNPFKYFLQKREKSAQTTTSVPVTTRVMGDTQLGGGQMCRELELLYIQPEIKHVVSQVYIEFDRIILGDLIGRGNFGRVYQGTLQTSTGYQKVAVKSTKYKAEETDMIEEFLKEALLMRDFKHPHVLSLIGVTFDLSSNPLVVLPFMSSGNLRAYIRDPQKSLSVHRLLGLGLQVGRGMEYLSKHKFVHRDLACRNCMVDEIEGNLVVKVADFGLSRDLYFKDYYRISDRMTPLPVRWMAPESLQNNIFKLESDVWSYGVVIWELLTRGTTPYPDVENWDINRYIDKGYRLEKPKYCPDKIYAVMQGCWNMEPAKRPGFSTIIQELEDHIHGEMYSSGEVDRSHQLRVQAK